MQGSFRSDLWNNFHWLSSASSLGFICFLLSWEVVNFSCWRFKGILAASRDVDGQVRSSSASALGRTERRENERATLRLQLPPPKIFDLSPKWVEACRQLQMAARLWKWVIKGRQQLGMAAAVMLSTWVMQITASIAFPIKKLQYDRNDKVEKFLPLALAEQGFMQNLARGPLATSPSANTPLHL
jgi:hypothetical protein